MYWNSWIQTTQLETSRTVILLPPTISFLCSNYLPTRYLRHHERRWNENPLRRTPTHWFPLSKSNFWQRTRWTKGYTKWGGVVNLKLALWGSDLCIVVVQLMIEVLSDYLQFSFFSFNRERKRWQREGKKYKWASIGEVPAGMDI